ncbi:MAG: hypothetical protein Q8Q94_00235 [bacterium]|nr:hypothetical protein [bacterium]
MNSITPTRIYNKLTRLEQEIQRLKAQAYLTLPHKTRTTPRYTEKAIMEAVRGVRDTIWNERYAKKITRIR